MDQFPGGEVLTKVKTSAKPAFQAIHEAVARSVGLLEEAAPKFFPKSGCISCHNVSIPLMALTEARRRGYAIKPASTQLLVKQTMATYSAERDNLMSGACGLLGSPGVGS